MVTTLDAVFVGQLRPLPPEGQPTGIYKSRVDGPVEITKLGVTGDHQADKRVHGGPEKAVHHYPAEHYGSLRGEYREREAILVPGALGENLSTRGMTETAVCIGDVFRMGSALLQVNQPRIPCWKINHRFDVETMSRFIEHTRITGWYYRVLTPGTVEAGDSVSLEEQLHASWPLRRFLDVIHEHRPRAEELAELLALAALSDQWKKRIDERRNWLARHA